MRPLIFYIFIVLAFCATPSQASEDDSAFARYRPHSPTLVLPEEKITWDYSREWEGEGPKDKSILMAATSYLSLTHLPPRKSGYIRPTKITWKSMGNDVLFQLAYIENGHLTSFVPHLTIDHNGLERACSVLLPNNLKSIQIYKPHYLSSANSVMLNFTERNSYQLPGLKTLNTIIIGDWVLTEESLYSSTSDRSNLPDFSLLRYVPKALQQKIISGLQRKEDELTQWFLGKIFEEEILDFSRITLAANP